MSWILPLYGGIETFTCFPFFICLIFVVHAVMGVFQGRPSLCPLSHVWAMVVWGCRHCIILAQAFNVEIIVEDIKYGQGRKMLEKENAC
jgi:hypothetical protein